MVVHKFGGSSLASAKRFKNVLEIISKEDDKKMGVVLSAVGGITDLLVSLIQNYESNIINGIQNKDKIREIKEEIVNKHHTIIKDLELEETNILNVMNDLFEIEKSLESCKIIKTIPSELKDYVLGHGEVWSNKIMTEYALSKKIHASFIDAREVLVLRNQEVLWDISESKLNKILEKEKTNIFFITGFIAQNENGTAATLKRNGSDYSAAIFSKLMKAKKTVIWTDVDGVLACDPRIVSKPVMLEKLSYEEASEMAYFGSKVIHPKTMRPLQEEKIPLWIKNSLNPKSPGTKISEDHQESQLIKGISSIKNCTMVNVEGKGMIGVSGISGRLFSLLKNYNIKMISQGNSEYSICFAVEDINYSDKIYIEKEIKKEFGNEIEKVIFDEDIVILAVIGEYIISHPGTAGKIFNVLGNRGINIKAIAQGSSQRNISLIISKDEEEKSCKEIYKYFFEEKKQEIVLIGPGMIGKELLNQISKNKDFNVKAIVRSKNMIIGENLKANNISDMKEKTNFNKLSNELEKMENPIIVDCTSNENVSKMYLQWLKNGYRIVTPNKKANTLNQDYYDKLMENKKNYRYEATVGAGLPVIKTIKNMIKTGDQIESIEGVFSGTLSYIFNNLTDDFKKIVSEAKNKGFTEPDPRDDLSGMDVARKILVLAREIGIKKEIKDLKIEPLYDLKKDALSVEEFMESLTEESIKINEMKKEGYKLMYTAKVDSSGEINISLKNYKEGTPFASLNGADNIIIIKSARYKENPLIIRGPGAGVKVTAAGIYEDILDLMEKS